jgi:simple sugar transport system ATP-binding protein
MVGHAVLEVIERTPFAPGDVVLSVRELQAENDKGLQALRGVSFDVRAGEILGIAGVAGNGQSELAQAITGLRPFQGLIEIGGQPYEGRSAWDAIRSGVAHVPEDRTGVGSAPNLSLVDNLIMKSYREAPISHGWAIDVTAARQVATALKDEYHIAAPSIDTQARLLSGGNLQRLILAREIESKPRLLVAVQPTRGLDVGAIEGVHRLLLARREAGAATVLISEDLDELLALSDRIAVLYEGRIQGIFETRSADVRQIGLLMTGGSSGDTAAGSETPSRSTASTPGQPSPDGPTPGAPGNEP